MVWTQKSCHKRVNWSSGWVIIRVTDCSPEQDCLRFHWLTFRQLERKSSSVKDFCCTVRCCFCALKLTDQRLNRKNKKIRRRGHHLILPPVLLTRFNIHEESELNAHLLLSVWPAVSGWSLYRLITYSRHRKQKNWKIIFDTVIIAYI